MNAERRSGGLPPGYPAHYEQEVVLSDGRQVLARPIRPSDAPELAEAIRTADHDRCAAGSGAARPVCLLRRWST